MAVGPGEGGTGGTGGFEDVRISEKLLEGEVVFEMGGFVFVIVY